MTTSNARKLNIEKNITMTRRVSRKNNLMMQKLAGIVMLIFVAACLAIGGRSVAAVILVPFAFAALFSKEKVLDFGLFSNKANYYR